MSKGISCKAELYKEPRVSTSMAENYVAYARNFHHNIIVKFENPPPCTAVQWISGFEILRSKTFGGEGRPVLEL